MGTESFGNNEVIIYVEKSKNLCFSEQNMEMKRDQEEPSPQALVGQDRSGVLEKVVSGR